MESLECSGILHSQSKVFNDGLFKAFVRRYKLIFSVTPEKLKFNEVVLIPGTKLKPFEKL